MSDKKFNHPDREENSKSVTEDLGGSNFKSARKSSVGNLGEDIAQSARHRAQNWREKTLSDVNKHILKNERQGKIDITPKTAIAALVGHLAIEKFPTSPRVKQRLLTGPETSIHEYSKPGGEKFLSRTSINAKDLKDRGLTKTGEMTGNQISDRAKQIYTHFFNDLHNEILSCAADGANCHDSVERIKKNVKRNLIRSRVAGLPNPTPIDASIGDMFIAFHNNALSSYKPGSIGDHVSKTLSKTLNHSSIDDTDRDFNSGKINPAALSTAVMDIISGKTKKPKNDKQEPEIDISERIGPKIGSSEKNGPKTGNRQAMESFLLNNAKIRGLQYGNSVSDIDRERHLDHIAHSLKDLSDTWNLPHSLLAFNKKLGLAVGARGASGRSAHYEPDYKVININKNKGSGSFAHEWMHFIDHMLAEQFNDGSPAASFSHGGGKGDEWHQTRDSMRDLRNKIKQIRFRILNDWRNHPQNLNVKSKALFGYWLRPDELLARSFEKAAALKLYQKGRKNTYLSSHKDHPLYPNEVETAELVPLFSQLFDSIKKNGKFENKPKLLDQRPIKGKMSKSQLDIIENSGLRSER